MLKKIKYSYLVFFTLIMMVLGVANAAGPQPHGAVLCGVAQFPSSENFGEAVNKATEQLNERVDQFLKGKSTHWDLWSMTGSVVMIEASHVLVCVTVRSQKN